MKIKELFHLRSQRKRLFQKDSKGLQLSYQCTSKRQVGKITMLIRDCATSPNSSPVYACHILYKVTLQFHPLKEVEYIFLFGHFLFGQFSYSSFIWPRQQALVQRKGQTRRHATSKHFNLPSCTSAILMKRTCLVQLVSPRRKTQYYLMSLNLYLVLNLFRERSEGYRTFKPNPALGLHPLTHLAGSQMFSLLFILLPHPPYSQL